MSPSEAKVPAVNPVRDTGLSAEAVNGGTYRARTNIWGLGVAWRFL